MIRKLLFVNILTLIRVIGTIFLVPIYFKLGGIYAGILSIICYLTDSIDGILARKWKVSTFFGALFDGVSDKLFTIVNFYLIFLITPYAIIPLIIELLIVILQAIKFSRNLNIKSNIVGKLKIWFLAVSIVLVYFISTSSNTISSKVYLGILLPTIVMEVLTLVSYIIEIFFKNNRKILLKKPKKINKNKLTKKEYKNYFLDVWFNPKFYELHKDDTNLRDLRKLSRKKF